jgi:protein-tyrosine phosphatase
MKDIDVVNPYALPVKYSYNIIQPDLAMGGALLDSSAAFEEFDILVLCAGEWQPHVVLPDEDKTKRVVRVPYDDSDTALIPSVLKLLQKTAKELAEEHKNGKRILVTCMMGRNRSGLLTALVLMTRFGMPAAEAIALIKECRGDFALTNETFTSYLLSL